MSINNAVLLGRMVENPELKTINGGVSTTTFRIAVDENFTNKNGERNVDFFYIEAWRNTAEFICKHFAKGDGIAIKGKLKTQNYTDKQGVKRYLVKILCDEVSFAGSKASASQPQSQPASQPQSQPAPQPQSQPAPQPQSQPAPQPQSQQYAPAPQQSTQSYQPAPQPQQDEGFVDLGPLADDDLPF